MPLFCLVHNAYFSFWFLLGPLYYLKINYLVSKYLGIINIPFCYWFFYFIHCGQKMYFTYFQSFYIYWGLFYGLAYVYVYAYVPYAIEKSTFSSVVSGIFCKYQLCEVHSICSVPELLDSIISKVYRWFCFFLCAGTAFCWRLWLWCFGWRFSNHFSNNGSIFLPSRTVWWARIDLPKKLRAHCLEMPNFIGIKIPAIKGCTCSTSLCAVHCIESKSTMTVEFLHFYQLKISHFCFWTCL